MKAGAHERNLKVAATTCSGTQPLGCAGKDKKKF